MEIQTVGVFVLFIEIFFSAPLIGAQSQAGFISLDCGQPAYGNYTSDVTGINYISDHEFINTGESGNISSFHSFLLAPELSYVRSFPIGPRNCYNFGHKHGLRHGDKYLIRARFRYGNYDNKWEPKQFELYIGPNRWAIVTVDKDDMDAKDYELIHVLTSENLQICLVKSGPTAPFISTLELRPLSSDTYNSTQSGSLGMPADYPVGRHFMSDNWDLSGTRFSGDIHDRIWTYGSFSGMGNWRPVNTSRRIDTNNSYDLPQVAVQNAAVPKNDTEDFVFSLSNGSPIKYQVFFHFAEVQTLKANDYREFNITFNGKYLYGPFSPRKFRADTIVSPEPLINTTEVKYTIGFQKTSRSTLPPILNAIEIYEVVELPLSGTAEADVNAIMDIKATYGLKPIKWEGDPCLPKDDYFLWDGLSCSYNHTNPPRITRLKLPARGLNGRIAPSIFNLSQLIELDLSNNNLTGEVPEFLAKMNSLSIINLSGNQLSGSVPQALREKEKNKTLHLNVNGNPQLRRHKGWRNVVVPVVASVASVAVVIALVITFLIIRKKKLINSPGPPSDRPPIKKDRRVSYSDIVKMTNNFERVLGRGGFGTVYHGHLNGTPVAVKALLHTSIQGYKQFMAEVELLLRVHHRNLVSLAGYCIEGDSLALIYEYMANGDLKEYLSGGHKDNVLSWASRLRIATEAAQGLEYLHNGCKPPMIHRDVKSTNILLNENFQAKLSDFGLSRTFTAGGESHVSTVVAGTPGYLDPEYFQTNRLTEKSDVYGFGVVLLEIITNRPVFGTNRETTHISEWTRQMLQNGDINRIADPRLRGDFDANSVWNFLELAITCAHPSSGRRPTMHTVVMELNQCFSMELARTQGRQYTNFTEDFLSEVNPNAASALLPEAR